MKDDDSNRSRWKQPGFVARALFSIWLGFMIATAGMLGFSPRLGQVSAPVLCHGGAMQVDTRHYRPSPGTQVTTRDFYCPDGSRIGLGKLLPATWIVYSAAIFVLVELVALLGRRIPAAAGPGVQIGLFLLLFCLALAVAMAYTEPVAAHRAASADGAAMSPAQALSIRSA